MKRAVILFLKFSLGLGALLLSLTLIGFGIITYTAYSDFKTDLAQSRTTPWLEYRDVPKLVVDAVMTEEASMTYYAVRLVDSRNAHTRMPGIWYRWVGYHVLRLQYTPEQVFELVANKAYMGHEQYGLTAAARFYFAKSVTDLRSEEAALLAGLIQGPSRFSPLERPERAQSRRNFILEKMASLGMIGQDEAKRAIATPIHIVK